MFPALLVALACGAGRTADAAPLLLDRPRELRLEFGGEIGRRIDHNIDAWLLPAPAANPGMLEMFRARDRKPAPSLVPWAGEFAGKYLVSAVLALDMTTRRDLRERVAGFVRELIETQAEDGYLGPFPKEERLLGHWDLWGHYHVILGLLLWHERTGDAEAMAAARRAADLMCRTYLGGSRRVIDAGSPEMNMAAIHGLAILHRKTGEARYLDLAREIEKDWEGAGDYLRQGLAGQEFYRTPRPRWESLHDIQGLVELWRLTGDEKYSKAFATLWRSIARLDRHNTGGFSSGEQAVGHPYSPLAIETCCTIAWMALTADMLRLTADPRAADELDLSTWNGMLGSQHPSGRWWTYSTPMDGVREASAHSIVFQARAGTPELNCCSVNGPRGLGMLSEWAVLVDSSGPVVEWLGPMTARFLLADGTPFGLEVSGSYPAGLETVRITMRLESDVETALRMRVPGWSAETWYRLEPVDGPAGGALRADAGKYLALRRRWKDGDALVLRLDERTRVEAGLREQAGRISVYRGPLLLAFDPRWNPFDEDAMPPLDGAALAGSVARVEAPGADGFPPILLVTLPATRGGSVRLSDFATAGATGRAYRSWLPAVNVPPAPVVLDRPRPGETVPAALAAFSVRPRHGAASERLTLHIAPAGDPAARRSIELERGRRFLVEGLAAGEHLWRVEARNAAGISASETRSALVDPALPAESAAGSGPLLDAPLRGTAEPARGELEDVQGALPAAGPSGEPGGSMKFDGKGGRARYRLLSFPEDGYAAHAWIAPASFPQGRIAQVMSAWSRPGDDPLRITIEGGKLFARIESGGRSFSTEGVPLELDRWVHVAAVKSGPKLVLYVAGAERSTAAVPEAVESASELVGLGGNPLFGGDESFHGSIARFPARGARARARGDPEDRGEPAVRSPRGEQAHAP